MRRSLAQWTPAEMDASTSGQQLQLLSCPVEDIGLEAEDAVPFFQELTVQSWGRQTLHVQG